MYPRRKTVFFFFYFLLLANRIPRASPRTHDGQRHIIAQRVRCVRSRPADWCPARARVSFRSVFFTETNYESQASLGYTENVMTRTLACGVSARRPGAPRFLRDLRYMNPTGTVRRLRAITRRNVFETRRLTTVRYFPATDPFGEGERRG